MPQLVLTISDDLDRRLDRAAASNGRTRWKEALAILEAGTRHAVEPWQVTDFPSSTYLPEDADVPPKDWAEPVLTERGLAVAERAAGILLKARPIYVFRYWDERGILMTNITA